MSVQLEYCIRGGHITHISEIKFCDKDEPSICPACGGILIAKRGAQRQWHFSHKYACNCDILYAQQTALHLIAKEIIRESDSILVPGIVISRQEVAFRVSDISAAKVHIDLPNIGACSPKYDSVEIEKMIGDVIADAVISINGTPCIVEIAVTHFVDDIKAEKLKKLNILAFEIDLSDLLERPQTRESIQFAVLSDRTNRYWIFNPKRERLLEEKKSEFQKQYDAVVEKQALEEQRKQAYRKTNLLKLQTLMKPENYAKELTRLRDDEKAAWWLKRFDFSEECSDYPFFMDIPITGEFVFSCDRRIWQGKLFEDYVCRGYCSTILQIRNRIFKGKMMIQYDKTKLYRTTLAIEGQERDVSFSYDVVRHYFDYLELLGFGSFAGWEWCPRRPASLAALPSVASVLMDILQSIDRSSPHIDRIIRDELLSRLSESKEKRKVFAWDR